MINSFSTFHFEEFLNMLRLVVIKMLWIPIKIWYTRVERRDKNNSLKVMRVFIWNLISIDPRSARLLIWHTGGRQEKNSCKHPGHGVRTHFLCELSRVVSARQGAHMRKSCPACQGYPNYRAETTRFQGFLPLASITKLNLNQFSASERYILQSAFCMTVRIFD